MSCSTNISAPAVLRLLPGRELGVLFKSRLQDFVSLVKSRCLARAFSALHPASSVKPASVNRFEKVLDRIRKDPRYHAQRNPAAPYGIFRGRSLIGEAGPINGGIYLGAAPQEAVVVDERYGLLPKAYQEFTMEFAREHGGSAKRNLERKVMQALVEFVRGKLSYLPEDQLRPLIEKHEGPLGPDMKVSLDVYLQHHVGTARHQVLLGAYLLEKLKSRGLLSGNVYIDPHCRDPLLEGERLIYASAAGYLFVFTPGSRKNTGL